MYNILGIFKGLNNNATDAGQLNESVKQPTVYETVEPQGSIMEAIKSLESKFGAFKEGIEDKIEAAREKAAAKGKIKDTAKEEPKPASRFVKGKAYGGSAQKDAEEKDDLDEGAKPDFLDVDKDGNKKETFKKAVKDKKAVKESADPKAQKGAQAILQALSPEEEQQLAATVKQVGNNPAALVKALGITPQLIKQAEQGQVAEGIAPTLGGKIVQALYTAGLLGTTVGAVAAGSPYLGMIAAPLLMAAGTIYGGAKGQVGHNPQKDVNESGGPYELYNPKHPKFKANYDKWMAKNPGKKLADFIEAMKKREHGNVEEAVRIKGSADYNGKLAAPKNQRERDEFAARAKHERAKNRNDMSTSANRQGLKSVQNPDKPWGTYHDLKATNVDEGAEFKDTFKNSTPKLSKAKPAKLKESRMMEGEYDYEKVGRMLAQQNPNLDSNSSEFVDAVYAELKKMGLTPKHAQYLIKYDEDFLGDAATSYGYFCKNKEDEVAESGDLVNDQIGVTKELDEIARLAGLKTEMDSKVPGDSDSPLTHANACPVCEADPCSCSHEEELDERETFPSMPKTTAPTPTAPAVKSASYDKSKLNPMEEEEMGEGNEFSGALAAAKASGAKEFEVGGKKYTVKESQVNEEATISVSATLEDDALNLMRKLAGMPVIADQTEEVCSTCGSSSCGCEAVAEQMEEGPKERDIEHTNTPREETAGADAAFPGGTDLNRPKKSYSDKPFRGDNPMAVAEAKEEALWKAYESMIKDVKA